MASESQLARFRSLTVGDLFGLTLATALSLACAASSLRAAMLSPLQVAAVTLDQLMIGASAYGLAVLFRERRRHYQPSPGHWLIWLIGPIVVVTLLSDLAAALTRTQGELFATQIRNICQVLTIVVSLAVSVRGLGNVDWYWGVSLGLALLWLGVSAIMPVVFIIQIPSSSFWLKHALCVSGNIFLLHAMVTLLAVVVDATRNVWRDWLHYLGVAVVEAYAGTTLVYMGALLLQWWSEALDFLGL